MKFLCEMVEDNFIATGDKSSECPHILVYIHNVHVHVPVLVHVHVVLGIYKHVETTCVLTHIHYSTHLTIYYMYTLHVIVLGVTHTCTCVTLYSNTQDTR